MRNFKRKEVVASYMKEEPTQFAKDMALIALLKMLESQWESHTQINEGFIENLARIRFTDISNTIYNNYKWYYY